MAHGKKTGGRQAGTPNKATAEIKEIAGQYSAEAIEVLIGVARNSDSDSAKVAAAKELLDRGHGRPAQAIITEQNAFLVLHHKPSHKSIIDRYIERHKV